MLQLRSIINPADNSGAKKLQIIHVYKGFRHRKGTVGDLVLAVVHGAIPNGIVKNREKVKVLIVRTKKEVHRSDGSCIRFSDNAGVVVDGSGAPRGTRVFGPVAREIKDAYPKIASMAKEVY